MDASPFWTETSVLALLCTGGSRESRPPRRQAAKPSLRACELLFEILRADGAVDGDARAEACDGLVRSTIGEAHWTVKSGRDGVREREQVQLASLGATHCDFNFSFLDGASHPEELAEQGRPDGHRHACGDRS